jgi:hypothetical protein
MKFLAAFPMLLLAVPFGIAAVLVLALAYYLRAVFALAGLLAGALGKRRGFS